MMNTTITSQLKKFGLEEKEAQIYLSLLKEGSQTPLEISRNTDINRTTIYRQLETLQTSGLVEEVLDDKSTRYTASDPDKLNFLIEQRENSIRSLKRSLPDLTAQLSALKQESISHSKVVFFRGIKGLKQLLWNTTKAKGKQIVNYGYLSWNEVVGNEFAEKLREEHVVQKIHGREVTNHKEDGTQWTDNITRVRQYYKEKFIPKSVLEINHDQYIYDDILAYAHIYKEEYFGIEIHNPEIAKTQKQIFEIIWEIGEEMTPFEPFKSKKWKGE
ncbi:ArsR family transcriptional regulator [Candidatus Dojkabacteria bacterium]|nr:ArsR family transcriptional regulator [Candidatus Dojkabacteria bacterium]